MNEKFKLVKPYLSQLDILDIELYCYLMKYKFVFDTKDTLILNEDKERKAYIQNGIRKVYDKETGKLVSYKVLNVVYGTDKVCLSDLFLITKKLFSEFLSRYNGEKNIEDTMMYQFLREPCEIDFFKRYRLKNENKEEEDFAVKVQTMDYKTQKEIIYNLISKEYPCARVLFRETEGNILIVSKEISSEKLNQIISKAFKTIIIHDKGIYERLRYGGGTNNSCKKTA